MSGPSKGYSVPRREIGINSRFCQKCSSTAHWTYQCTTAEETKAKTSLSASQLLRLGIKRKRVEVIPEMSEREKFNEGIRQREKELDKILRMQKKEEATVQVQAEPLRVSVKKEKERDDPTEFTDLPE